jgi:hypothetical protein
MRLIRDSRQGTMTPEEMRARARQCEQIAQEVSDFGAKEIYEQLAQKWRAMTAQAERIKSDGNRPSGVLESKEMEHREAHHLDGMDISAVQNIQVEGRHSDQSCRHTAEHC